MINRKSRHCIRLLQREIIFIKCVYSINKKIKKIFFLLKYILQNTCMLNNAHKILYAQSIQVKCFELYTRFPQQFFFISLNCYIVPSKIIIVIYIWNGYFIYFFFLSWYSSKKCYYYIGRPPALSPNTTSHQNYIRLDWERRGEKLVFFFKMVVCLMTKAPSARYNMFKKLKESWFNHIISSSILINYSYIIFYHQTILISRKFFQFFFYFIFTLHLI